MQIHVVQEKQTIKQIAEYYSTPEDEIVKANELETPEDLVTGQAIVIPIIGSFYWVQSGDTLYKIAQQHQISYQKLAEINRINPQNNLSVGKRLYLPPHPKQKKESNAYLEPFGSSVSSTLTQSTQKASPYLTYISLFPFLAQRNGSLKEPPSGTIPSIAKTNDNNLILTVANLENGAYSDELGRLLITPGSIQNNLLNNIVTTAKKYNITTILFDFEFLFPEDREKYNTFLKKAKTRFHAENWLLGTALAPKTSRNQSGKWYEAHDYKAHGEIADFSVIMTYEWGYSGGPPLPVSPLPNVKQVLTYAKTEMPVNKILMGQNLYGYDWTLPYKQGGDPAKAVSPQRAIQIARENNVSIKYDTYNQAPFIDYTDKDKKTHKVWFEDARSIQAKFNLIKELNLRGISYWKLGLSFPQNWLLLYDNFQIIKNKPIS